MNHHFPSRLCYFVVHFAIQIVHLIQPQDKQTFLYTYRKVDKETEIKLSFFFVLFVQKLSSRDNENGK